MLRDEARMRAYARAIREVVRPGDVVLDLGSGTGILAMLARDAGARRVFAVEQSHMADVASMLAAHNAREIEVLHGWSFEVELPERANVLVTETLSNFGLDEGLVTAVLDARKRLLTSDARIVPQSVTMTIAPVEVPPLHAANIASWDDAVEGLDFSPLRALSSAFLYGIDVSDAHLLGTPKTVCEVDLRTVDSPSLSVSATFAVGRDGTLHGFAGWFDATLTGEVRISNAPPRGASHWGQALLPIDPPIALRAGEEVRLDLDSPRTGVWRWSGQAGACRFDHSTALALTPCIRQP